MVCVGQCLRLLGVVEQVAARRVALLDKRRAELLGVSRSVWFEISQRSVGAIAAFLEAAERTDDLGGSSSAG